MGNKSTYNIVSKTTELYYLAIVAAYVLKLSFGGTLFHIVWPENYEFILRVAACIVVSLRLAYVGSNMGKGCFAGILAYLLLTTLSWASTGYVFLMDTALLIAGAVNIPYRKILKVGFWVGLFVLLIAMLGTFTGCIRDLVYQSDGQFRHSFGIAYPTDFAAHVAFLVLAGWVLYENIHSILLAACALGLTAFTYCYNRAKCSAAILILCALSIIYISLTKKYLRKFRLLYRFSKWINAALIGAMPVCAVLIIGLCCFYNCNNAWMEQVNELLSQRLRLGKQAMDNYGITWFGTAFDQIGYGGGTVWSNALTYNFVDSSYVLILVRYGAVTLLAICVQYIWLEKKALRTDCHTLAVAAALAAVHSMIEHHLPEVCFNLFLLLPFADFTQDSNLKHIRRTKRSHITTYIVVLAMGAAMALALPRLVTYLKTIVNLLRLNAPENNIIFIAIITALLLAICVISRALLRLLETAAKNRTFFKPKMLIMPSIACVFLLTGFVYFERVIRQGTEKYQPLLEFDQTVIEALTASAGTADKLCIDFLPELYARKFHGIDHMIMAAEGLAFQKDVTLITKDEGELYALTETGYSYGSLPSGNAVYTSSASAKEILEEVGIVMTDYYSRLFHVDLKDAALRNNLDLTEDNTLLLDGSSHSLWHGSGITIYYGMLHVEYKLRLTNCTITEDTVAAARISSDWGATIWNQADITLEDFDENKECTYVIDTYLNANCPGMEFLLIIPDGVQMEILEIKYGKI